MILTRTKNKLQVGNLIITADRWPWQDGYGWSGTGGPTAPMNRSGARFGAGWRYRLGVSIGGTTVMLDLLFGMVRLHWESAADRAWAAQRKAEADAWLKQSEAERKAFDAELATIRAGRTPAPKVDAFGDDIPF
ncbi:hypothetical protein [Methylobacterium fujisawaense]